MIFVLIGLAGAVVGVAGCLVLVGIYQAGKAEGFDAGFQAALEPDEAPTHAELQAQAAREGRQ